MSRWRTACQISHGRNLQLPVRLPPPPSRLPLSRRFNSVHASDLAFGQPLHETHPHLLNAGELTPGITAIEYALRRAKLAAKLPKNAVAIAAASSVKYRSGNVFYKFHQ